MKKILSTIIVLSMILSLQPMVAASPMPTPIPDNTTQVVLSDKYGNSIPANAQIVSTTETRCGEEIAVTYTYLVDLPTTPLPSMPVGPGQGYSVQADDGHGEADPSGSVYAHITIFFKRKAAPSNGIYESILLTKITGWWTSLDPHVQVAKSGTLGYHIFGKATDNTLVNFKDSCSVTGRATSESGGFVKNINYNKYLIVNGVSGVKTTLSVKATWAEVSTWTCTFDFNFVYNYSQ